MTDGAGRTVRHAIRSLLRTPGATAAAVLTLAVGVAAVSALFGAVYSVLLQPLPVRDQESIVTIQTRHHGRNLAHYPFTNDAYSAVQDAAPSLLRVAGVDAWGAVLRPVGNVDDVLAARVARARGDLFGVLGVVPAEGRLLRPDDDVPGGPRVAVLSQGFRQRAFGNGGAVAGRTLTIAGVEHAVVGVLPPDFDSPPGADVWTPLRPQYPDWTTNAPLLELDLVGRLAAGASKARVRAEVASALAATPELRRTYADTEVIVRGFAEAVHGNLEPALLALFAAALLVLVIAGFNLANLFVARAAGRSRQTAVRLALGGETRHLASGLIAESLLIGATGGTLGFLLGWAGTRMLVPLVPPEASGIVNAGLHPAALWFALVATLLVVLLAGILELLGVVRTAPATALRGGAQKGATGRPGLLQKTRIATQTALAVTALAGAVLLLRTAARLDALDAGFDRHDLVMVRYATPYAHFSLPPTHMDNVEWIRERISRHPGVLAATPALTPPQAGSGGFDAAPYLEGQARDAPPTAPYLSLELAAPGFFATLGIPIVRGRAFGTTDDARSAAVAVVNETAARALWPGEDPLGKRLNWGFPGHENTWWTVVGLAADTRYRELLDVRPAVYLPLRQLTAFAPPYFALRLRPGGPIPDGLLPALQRAMDEVDPNLRVLEATRVDDILARPTVLPAFAAMMLTIFAGIALFLAAIGIWGVATQHARGSTREFGVRLSLGAVAADIFRLVLRRTLAPTLAGAVLGIAVAVATSRFLEPLLFETRPTDPLALAAATLVVAVAALLAGLGPAGRAARVAPAESLRAE